MREIQAYKTADVDMLYADTTVSVVLDHDGWLTLLVSGRSYSFQGLGMAPEEARRLGEALIALADEEVS